MRCSGELLTAADVISVHVDGRSCDADPIGGAGLARMQPGSLLLDLRHGSVVDLAALRRHVSSGQVGGAALDGSRTSRSAPGTPSTASCAG